MVKDLNRIRGGGTALRLAIRYASRVARAYRAVIAALVLAACAAPPRPQRPLLPAEPPAPIVAPLTAPAVAPELEPEPTAPACPPLDRAKLAGPTCDTSIIATPVPDIIDARGSLSFFYERLAALARGRATDHVRMAMYGDSNLTMDGITGQVRRHWQTRLGDGGHGWVSLARPWGWYQHEDVRHSGTWRHFRQIATSTDQIKDAHYGLANIAAEAYGGGAAAWVATARETSPVGLTASRFDLYWLQQPTGGDFDVLVDGKRVTTITTRSTTFENGFRRFDLPDGPHELRAVHAGHGAVRLFGVTLERETPGVVVDSLGAGALNFEQMAHVKTSTRKPMVDRRHWDLVAFQLGTNMFALSAHKDWAKAVIADLRASLPEASFLIVAPADVILEVNDPHSDPRIVTIVRQLREIAAETGSAFWDFREAMGGDASIRSFIKRDLAERDRVHLKKAGSALMGDRLLCALTKDLDAYLVAHPDAGCGVRPE